MVWIKWVLFLLFKSAIELPFVVAGPVALACHYLGIGFVRLDSDTFFAGAWLCTLFSLVALPDWIYTLLMPWVEGTGNFPVWAEESQPFARKHETSGAF